MFALPQSRVPIPTMNPWEDEALAYNFPPTISPAPGADNIHPSRRAFQPGQDPIIFPGLYAPSGIDVMTVLFSVFARPGPTVDLGPVDCSAALTLCNLDLPGCPIVYANDAFSTLTGHAARDVIGRNCHFLQSPHNLYPAAGALDRHSAAMQRLHHAVVSRTELQLPIASYKKNGQEFTNLMSWIPIRLPNHDAQYAVAFHVAID